MTKVQRFVRCEYRESGTRVSNGGPTCRRFNWPPSIDSPLSATTDQNTFLWRYQVVPSRARVRHIHIDANNESYNRLIWLNLPLGVTSRYTVPEFMTDISNNYRLLDRVCRVDFEWDLHRGVMFFKNFLMPYQVRIYSVKSFHRVYFSCCLMFMLHSLAQKQVQFFPGRRHIIGNKNDYFFSLFVLLTERNKRVRIDSRDRTLQLSISLRTVYPL